MERKQSPTESETEQLESKGSFLELRQPHRLTKLSLHFAKEETKHQGSGEDTRELRGAFWHSGAMEKRCRELRWPDSMGPHTRGTAWMCSLSAAWPIPDLLLGPNWESKQKDKAKASGWTLRKAEAPWEPTPHTGHSLPLVTWAPPEGAVGQDFLQEATTPTRGLLPTLKLLMAPTHQSKEAPPEEHSVQAQGRTALRT